MKTSREKVEQWQRQFFRQVTKGASPDPRLDIYASGYQQRLYDAVEEDFPRLKRQLGKKSFHTLLESFVSKRGSQRSTLSELSGAFHKFVLKLKIGPEAKNQSDLDIAILRARRRARFAATQENGSPETKVAVAPGHEWVESSGQLVTYRFGKLHIYRLHGTKLKVAQHLSKPTTLTRLASKLAKEKVSPQELETTFTQWSKKGWIHLA
jgi:hypothetical protein